MLIKVPDRKTVRIATIKRYAYERQGWVCVTEGYKGPRQYACSCQNPCGFRAFPGVKRLRDLQWSDCMALWRRALKAQGTRPGGPDSIEVWEKAIVELKHAHRRMADAGLITKHSDLMLLAKIPGPILRGLGHDYPAEFSPTLGARSEQIEYHLEKVMDHLFIHREHGRPMGAIRNIDLGVAL